MALRSPNQRVRKLVRGKTLATVAVAVIVTCGVVAMKLAAVREQRIASVPQSDTLADTSEPSIFHAASSTDKSSGDRIQESESSHSAWRGIPVRIEITTADFRHPLIAVMRSPRAASLTHTVVVDLEIAYAGHA